MQPSAADSSPRPTFDQSLVPRFRYREFIKRERGSGETGVVEPFASRSGQESRAFIVIVNHEAKAQLYRGDGSARIVVRWNSS